MTYEVIYWKNGIGESDNRVFNTLKEAEAWKAYTERMMTPQERKQYTLEIIEIE